MLIGSPTLELYVNSWNAKYPNNRIYIATNSNGYYVGSSENPTTYNVQESNSDTLYYPHNAQYENCDGYWLASPSAENVNSVLNVIYLGFVNRYTYHGTYGNNDYAFRPVICLPSSILQ